MRRSRKQRRKSKAAENLHITVSINPDWVTGIKVITCLSRLESTYFHWYRGICKLLAFALHILCWHSLHIKHNSTKLNSEKNTKTRNREKGKLNRTCPHCFFSSCRVLFSNCKSGFSLISIFSTHGPNRVDSLPKVGASAKQLRSEWKGRKQLLLTTVQFPTTATSGTTALLTWETDARAENQPRKLFTGKISPWNNTEVLFWKATFWEPKSNVDSNL